jgi:hypothetical protein
MQRLYYESELGDDVNVEYFKLKEARITELDKLNDPLK